MNVIQPGFGPEADVSAIADFPRTYEEAYARLADARAAYDIIATPEVDLPDTPPLTLGEVIQKRTFTYWLDRSPAAMNPSREAALHIIEAPTPELTEWAADKSVAAGAILREHGLGGTLIERWPEAVPDELSPQEAQNRLDYLAQERDFLATLKLARIKVEIQEGKPVMVPNSYGALGGTMAQLIRERRIAWEAKHRFLTRHAPQLLNIALRAPGVLAPAVISDLYSQMPSSGLQDTALIWLTEELYG